jgi:Fe-S-cluster-containing dehydrogenase component
MQLGFYFDQTRCTNCFACVVACYTQDEIAQAVGYTQQNVNLALQEMADLPKPVNPAALYQVDFEISIYNAMDAAIN